nr:mucin-5AC-like [Osmia lignaria]
MKKLVIMVAIAVSVTVGHKERRNSALENFPPYPDARQGLSFHEQHQPFREASFHPQQYQSYRHRPYRQDLSSFAQQLSYRDQSLPRDYSSPKNRPFYTDGSFFRDTSNYKGQSSFFSDGASFKDQTRLKNEILKDQTLNDQYSYQQPSFRDDFRFADLYDKPISSYREQQPEEFSKESDYLKHGNHGLGYIPMPPVSPYQNASPLNEGTSTTTTPSMVPTTTHVPLLQSNVSSVAPAISQVHTSATSEPKMASLKGSHTVTMPTVKSDTLAEVSTTSSPMSSDVTVMSVSTEQSSNLAHPQMPALTTEASLPPVMATESPVLSFGRQSLLPIEFQSSKFTTPSSYYFSPAVKNKLQQSLLSYLLSQQEKNPLKINEQSTLLSNYASPDVLSNSLDNKIPGPVLNYVLPAESKNSLKNNLQTSLLNYLLQQESNRGLSFQPSTPSTETVNYLSLATLAEKPKLTLPTVPIATLSAVSRPLQTLNYVPVTMPRTPSFVTQDSSVSSLPILPLGSNSLSTFSSNLADTQATGVFNSLSGGLSGGIASGIPGNIATTVPASIPTLNFAQNFQHVDQTRQFEPARSNPFSTGLQLQLGGFGGIDYTLRSPNPAPRPLELGIAKVGLSLPELPRHQLSTLSKVPFGHQFW